MTTVESSTSSFIQTQPYPPPPPDHQSVADGAIRGLVTGSRSCWAITVQCIVLIGLWLFAVFGNVLVCLVIQRSRRVQSTTNYFVKSMAYSDIVLVLMTSPVVCLQLIRDQWEIGHIACRMVRFFQLAAMACTAFTLMAICFDRFYTIIYPLSFKVTRGTAKRMIVGSWVLAAVMSSLCIYVFDEVRVFRFSNANYSVRHICPTYIPVHHWTGQIYSCVLVLGHFLCPVSAVFFGYFRVMYYIHQARIKVQIRRSSNVVPRNKVKMVKTLLVLTASTLLSYAPFFIVQLFYSFNRHTFLSPDIFIAAYTFISLSAAMKPVLFACRNSNFWRGCKEVLCMSGMKCYRLNTYTITTASRFGKKNFIGVMDLSQEQANEGLSSNITIQPMCGADSKNSSPWSLNGAAPSTPF